MGSSARVKKRLGFTIVPFVGSGACVKKLLVLTNAPLVGSAAYVKKLISFLKVCSKMSTKPCILSV